MEEQLISFETAKLAKEKGFDWDTPYIYWSGTEIPQGLYDWLTNESKVNINLFRFEKLGYIDPKYDNIIYFASTQSLLQKWLREIHKIHIIIHVNGDNEGDEETYWTYSYISRFDNVLHDDAFSCSDNIEFSLYEEALEEALKTILDLIEC